MHTMSSRTWIAMYAVLIPLAVTEILQTDLCDSGWHRNGTYCYYVYEGTEVTWFEARNNCLDMESNLVSIFNAKENMFIESIRNSSLLTWIGLRRNVKHGMDTWNWTDGTEFAYNHSDLIQSVDKAFKKCTMIARNGSWIVVRCKKENVKSFICKKAATVVATSIMLMPSTTDADEDTAAVQDITSDYTDVSTKEMTQSPGDTVDNINKDKQKLGNDSTPLTFPVSVGVVLCVVVVAIIVTVVIFLKRRRRNRPQVENEYGLPPVTSSNSISDELPVNGVVGNGETGGTSGTADLSSEDVPVYSECALQERPSLQEGTDPEHGRTCSTQDPGADVTALYAVVKKPARNLTDLELEDNANYVSFGE